MYKKIQIGLLEIFVEVFEKINFLLQEKSISKKEFVDRLRGLEPRLRGSGEIPSEQTIYRYLNGSRELKVELISYIAEALGVSEQELFSFEIEYAANHNYKRSKEVREIVDLLQYAPIGVVEHIKTQLEKHKRLYMESVKSF